MNIPLFSFVRHSIDSLGQPVKRRLRQWTKPDNHTLVFNTVLYDTVQGAAVDLTRSKPALVMENALLRQQLVVLQRQTKRLTLTWRDRAGPPPFQHLLPIDPMDGLCHTPAVCFHFWAATIHRVTPTGLLLSEKSDNPQLSGNPHRFFALCTISHA